MDAEEKTFEVRTETDKEFEISLDSIPGSGAIWYLAQDLAAGPELVRQESAPQTSLAGGTTTQTFVFRGGRPGTYDLAFELKRAWESHVRRRATVTVHVS